MTRDIDAAFSRRIALPEELEVSYRDADGAARMLHFDRQYNDTLALLHEDAYEDSEPIELRGVDIATLARHKLIDSATLRERAEEALGGYVGDTARVKDR